MMKHLICVFLFGIACQDRLVGGAPCDPRDESGWTQFRGPAGSGICSPRIPLPARLDPESNLVWKVDAQPGHSSPIVVGDAIFLTGFEPGKLSTVCFDRSDGAVRWRRDIEVAEFEKAHPQHGPASPTPVSDGDRVFVVFGSFGIIAYDLAGNELWRQAREIHRNMFGSASSPIIVDGQLIVFTGCEDESLLQALDPASGKALWERRHAGPASSWSTPVPCQLGSEKALLVYEPFRLCAVSMKDGTELWSVPGLADEPITTPQLGAGLIFTSSYNLRTNKEAIGLPSFAALLKECDSNGDGALDAVEVKTNKSILSRPDADGEGDHPLRMFFRTLDADRDGSVREDEWPRIHSWMEPWNHANGLIAVNPGENGMAPSLAWQFETGVPECPTPLIWDGKLFAVRNGGVITCLDASHGTLLFQERIAPGGPYYASPVGGDGKIYLASARGSLSVLAADKQPKVLDTQDLGEPIWATPALEDSQVIVRSAGHLWVFGESQPAQ